MLLGERLAFGATEPQPVADAISRREVSVLIPEDVRFPLSNARDASPSSAGPSTLNHRHTASSTSALPGKSDPIRVDLVSNERELRWDGKVPTQLPESEVCIHAA